MDIEKKYSQCGSYTILKTLGSGFHAKVKMATNTEGQHFAIKIFKNDHALAQNIKALANEINIMQKLSHPNLVNLIEFNQNMPYQKKSGQKDSRVCIVLELASGGELFEYVAQTGRFSEETCRFYTKQLMDALAYLHGNNIAHRDLKPENLLFDSDFNLKVADFGFASIMNKYSDGKLKTTLGTEGYMAPEINLRQAYDGKSVDIFAAAVVIFIMYAGAPPFSKAVATDPYYKLIVNNKFEMFWKFHAKHKNNPNFFSPEFIDLITGMIQYDPKKRYTLEQIQTHSWWTKGAINTPENIKNEFNQRKYLVEAEIEKEKLRKQAIKAQQQKTQGGIHTGIGNFRSNTDGDQYNFEQIEIEYNLKDSNRTIAKIDQNILYGSEFNSALDGEFILRYLLLNREKFAKDKLVLDDNHYKIKCANTNADGNQIEFNIQLKQFGENLVNIDFKKIQGDNLFFHQTVKQVQDLILQA